MNFYKVFDDAYRFATDRLVLRIIAAAIAASIVFGAGWFGYSFYRSHVNARAQEALAHCLDEYERAIHLGEAHAWREVEIAGSEGYKFHESSDVAPFFLTLQADALLAQGKAQEGLDLLKKAVKSMSKRSPLYYFYATKAALVERDVTGSPELLRELSQDVKNSQRDMALYYLGHEELLRGDEAKAREYWSQLLSQQHSVWAQIAQSELSAVA